MKMSISSLATKVTDFHEDGPFLIEAGVELFDPHRKLPYMKMKLEYRARTLPATTIEGWMDALRIALLERLQAIPAEPPVG